jgi:hypothetical protein
MRKIGKCISIDANCCESLRSLPGVSDRDEEEINKHLRGSARMGSFSNVPDLRSMEGEEV